MSRVMKKLCGAILSTTDLTTIYTVPLTASCTVTCLCVTNKDTEERTVKVAQTSHVTPVAGDYFIDSEFDSRDAQFISVGITANAGDSFQAQASSGDKIVISLWGFEDTP